MTISGGSGAWSDNGGTFNPSTSTVIFTNAAATISGATTFYNVTINSGAGLTLGSGGTMAIGGTMINNGAWRAAQNANNTVEYNGGSQTVLSPNGLTPGYDILILSGSGTKAMPSTTTVIGNVEINSGVQFNLSNGGSSIAGSLTFGGVLQAAGSWGSTSSPATHKDNTRFQGTGVLNVSNGALDHFAISAISSPQTADTAINAITLTAQDANNNTVTNFGSTVAYGGTAGITGTSATFTAGQLTGVSVTPTVAGNSMTFIVTGSGKTGTSTFDVNPGALDHFTISAISSPQTAGTAIAGIALRAQDVNNNTLNTGPNAFTGTVTYGGTAGITGTSAAFTAGQLTGASVTPTVAGSSMTFIVAGSTKTGTSTFDVNPGAASAAYSTLTPATASITAGGSTTVLTVQTWDVNTNNLTTGGSTVVISLSSGAGSVGSTTDNGNGTYTATVTSPTATGSGTFVATLGGVLVGTAVGMSSSVITYTPGAIHHYDVNAPSPQTVYVPFTTTVTAKDANGNTVTTDNSTVVTMTSSGSAQFDSDGNAIFGDNTKTLSSGTFTISTKDYLAESVTITAASADGKTGASSPITVNAADFRSAASGDWNDEATWERFDGSAWVAAAATPSSADGFITIRSGHTVTVTADVTVDQVVVAAGGQVAVNNDITWTVADGAGTDLDLSGTLLVNGSLAAASAVTVKSGATLGGTGAIDGNVTVNSGGIVSPGASIGTLIVVGDFTFESGSTCTVEVSASPNGNVCDKLDVSGTLTLNNATLNIGTLSGAGCTIASNATSIVGTFKDLANGAALPAPNASYYIHYVDNGTDDYIVLNQSPTAAEAIIRAYAAAGGVVVEFLSVDEAGKNDIVLYLYRNGQWVEVGRRPAAGAGSHMYRFVVPGLNAGDIANLLVRDDEGLYHTASNLAVGNFSARLALVDNTGLTLQWESIPGRTYDIYREERLKGPWEVIEPPVEAAQTQTVTLISIDAAKPIEFFKIGMRE